MEGVHEVDVSLSALDPRPVAPTALEDTLRSLGYTVRDPRKVRSFDEQEEELRLERRRLILAGLFTAASIALMLVMWLELVSQSLPQPLMLVTMPLLTVATVSGPGLYILKLKQA